MKHRQFHPSVCHAFLPPRVFVCVQKECAKYYTALTVDKSTKSQRRTRAAGVAEPGQRVLRKVRL